MRKQHQTSPPEPPRSRRAAAGGDPGTTLSRLVARSVGGALRAASARVRKASAVPARRDPSLNVLFAAPWGISPPLPGQDPRPCSGSPVPPAGPGLRQSGPIGDLPGRGSGNPPLGASPESPASCTPRGSPSTVCSSAMAMRFASPGPEDRVPITEIEQRSKRKRTERRGGRSRTEYGEQNQQGGQEVQEEEFRLMITLTTRRRRAISRPGCKPGKSRQLVAILPRAWVRLETVRLFPCRRNCSPKW